MELRYKILLIRILIGLIVLCLFPGIPLSIAGEGKYLREFSIVNMNWIVVIAIVSMIVFSVLALVIVGAIHYLLQTIKVWKKRKVY